MLVVTNAPVHDPDSVHQNKSYIVGIYPKKYNNTSMFIDITPFHSFRTTSIDKREVLIVRKEYHSIGEVKNTWKCYKKLIDYTEETFDTNDVEYFWPNQITVLKIMFL